jgi:hypothetical protein
MHYKQYNGWETPKQIPDLTKTTMPYATDAPNDSFPMIALEAAV